MSESRPGVVMPQLDREGRIAESWPCVECGYDLRTMQQDGNCPECGACISKPQITREMHTWPNNMIHAYALSMRVVFAGLVFLSVAACLLQFGYSDIIPTASNQPEYKWIWFIQVFGSLLTAFGCIFTYATLNSLRFRWLGYIVPAVALFAGMAAICSRGMDYALQNYSVFPIIPQIMPDYLKAIWIGIFLRILYYTLNGIVLSIIMYSLALHLHTRLSYAILVLAVALPFIHMHTGLIWVVIYERIAPLGLLTVTEQQSDILWNAYQPAQTIIMVQLLLMLIVALFLLWRVRRKNKADAFTASSSS